MESEALFPKLNEEQINQLSEWGKVRKVEKGYKLIEVGDRNHDFFVVLEGEIGLYNDDQQRLGRHGVGEFTGNSDSLSERTAVFNAVANADSKVLQISQEKLKELLAKNQEISELLLRTFLLRRSNELEQNIGTVKLIGSSYSPETFRLREFFSKNHVQHDWIDLEGDASSGSILNHFGVGINETPLVIANHEKVYKNPTLEEIAEVLGLTSYFTEDIFDVIVVGAGPAGLAASVYAASEGLKVVAIDSIGPGGQAGSSSRIENYLGFPTGISGSELANRAYIQAQKFGCLISIPHKAQSLTFAHNYFQLQLESGEVLKGSTIVAATGASYRRLPIANLKTYEGCGVYYGASAMEAQATADKEVIIVGGGNSAGQAAIFLSKTASCVHLLIRSSDLQSSMSSYLINRIENSEKIKLHTHTEVKALRGDSILESVTMENNQTGDKEDLEVGGLFLFLGAVPSTEWLKEATCLDSKGFVYTGRDIPKIALSTYKWSLKRKPYSLEACMPGLFVVGDMRHGSVKRVASAVGEGAMAISQVHTFLSTRRVL